MDWKRFFTSPWLAAFGMLDIIWGVAREVITDDGILNFLIVSQEWQIALISSGITLLVLYIVGKILIWKGEGRSLGEAIGKLEISEETLTNILGPLGLLAIFIFVLSVIFIVVLVVRFAMQVQL